MSRIYVIGVRPEPGVIYVGRTLKPGTYRLDSVAQQGQWSSCFGDGTRAFRVEPGKVYYLGTFNSFELLKDLERSALARKQAKLSPGGLAVGWNPTVMPNWSVARGELEQFRAFARTAMPRSTAPVEQLSTEPAQFSVKGSEKLVQVCG